MQTMGGGFKKKGKKTIRGVNCGKRSLSQGRTLKIPKIVPLGNDWKEKQREGILRKKQGKEEGKKPKI